jgi:hypothetical protein
MLKPLTKIVMTLATASIFALGGTNTNNWYNLPSGEPDCTSAKQTLANSRRECSTLSGLALGECGTAYAYKNYVNKYCRQ